MKIVYLGRFNKGAILPGPDKYTINLLNIISKEINVTFIEYYFKSYYKSSFLTRLFGSEIVNDSPPVIRLGNIRLLIYLIKHQPEIIHILTAERFTILFFLYKIILKGKIITTFHSVLRYEIPNDPFRKRKTGKYKDYIWENLAMKFSDKLIFLSKQHIELAKQFYYFDNNKTVIIPHGVDLEFYNPTKIINIEESINIVFYNGINDSIDRGLDSIISILNRLNSKRIKFYIIGNHAKIINADFYYEFVSPMDKPELINFLKDKHILLKSIVYDSFPIFALECMAAGLILIVSEKVGISSYITNGENGFIYKDTTLNEFRIIIENLINRKYNLQQISENARKIVKQLSWEKIGKQYSNLYQKVNEN